MQYLLYNFIYIWIIVKHTAFKPKLSNIVIENINFPRRRNLQSSYWTMHDVFRISIFGTSFAFIATGEK